MILETLLVFVLGASIGSFLNVCIYRIPAGESIVSPPSHCFACGEKLGLVDLIPILSYFHLRGKCRRCGEPFSWQYPLVEFATGFLFVLVFLRFTITWETLAGWVFLSILVAVTVIDIHHRIIPDKIVIAGLVLGLPLVALQSWESLMWGVVAFFAAGLFMLAIMVISRGGMGMGDIKLAALMGLYLGLMNVAVALFLAFLVGGVVGIALLVTRIKGRKDAVPFGPYLALGGFAALLWGNQIVNWYMSLWC
ncbi:MAG: prepilin peptidase [Desulforudis sp.]|jgi:leader peptidase (prepilin peptidase)/N-methyltransferase|nr:MAG: prepilin peptidase [Desulforudis sp.]